MRGVATLRGGRVSILMTLAMTIGWFAPAVFCAPPRANAVQQPSDSQTELFATLDIIRNSELDGMTRRDAVVNLLDRRRPDAVDALVHELETNPDAGTRRVIVQGLRHCLTAPPRSFAPVLVTLLKTTDESSIDDMATVLGRIQDPAVLTALGGLAIDTERDLTVRRAATATLGFYRSQSSAEQLIKLTAEDTPETLRVVAFASLARLSGIVRFADDAAKWREWWSQHRGESRADFQAHLTDNFAWQAGELARARAQLEDRLGLALRRRYRAAPEDERQQVLIDLLGDESFDSVRLVAMELARELVNLGQVNAPLTKALLMRLDDPTPALRARATLLLRDMRNEAAADIVAARLADGEEQHLVVLRAYLLLMHRLPHPAAVEPALKVIGDAKMKPLRGEAAGALLAAATHDPPLLGEDQRLQIAALVRTQMWVDTASPEPRFIELLGQIGEQRDWEQIQEWIGHEDNIIKEAAARTWAASKGRPLDELAKRADDPIIQAIVIPAASQLDMHPPTDGTMLNLAQRKPASDSLTAGWARALVAMAPHVSPAAVAEADAHLAQQGAASDLRLQVLSGAIDPLLTQLSQRAPSDSLSPPFLPQLADLLLRRATARIAGGDAKAAHADLDRIDELAISLSGSQLDAYELARIGARLAAGDVAAALSRSEKFIVPRDETAPDPKLQQRVTDMLLSAAERLVASAQPEKATLILNRLENLYGPGIKTGLRERIGVLRARITRAAATDVD